MKTNEIRNLTYGMVIEDEEGRHYEVSDCTRYVWNDDRVRMTDEYGNEHALTIGELKSNRVSLVSDRGYYWFAFMTDDSDSDWGHGTYIWDDAEAWLTDEQESNADAYIAVILAKDDPICVDEIHEI